jgi:prepilin-type N-terminal cleavage/methylation domain-containing protein
MSPLQTKSRPAKAENAFSLVELLVVIAIISILMTAGSIGLSGLGGKGVTSGVTNAEALFSEARSAAVGKNLRSCVLVAKSLTNNSSENLRRIMVGTEPVDADGKPTNPPGATINNWVLSNRGAVLPEQTYFSSELSKKDHSGVGGPVDTVTLSGVKSSYQGEYYVYIFNSQGILIDPTNPNYNGGASFVIGAGAKRANATQPVVTSSAKRDFGGFVIWRNGGTSVFRGPDQISTSLPDIGKPF